MRSFRDPCSACIIKYCQRCMYECIKMTAYFARSSVFELSIRIFVSLVPENKFPRLETLQISFGHQKSSSPQNSDEPKSLMNVKKRNFWWLFDVT